MVREKAWLTDETIEPVYLRLLTEDSAIVETQDGHLRRVSIEDVRIGREGDGWENQAEEISSAVGV